MGNGIFDPKSATGVSLGDLKKDWDRGVKVWQGVSAWSLKRKLQQLGYDAITIDAAVAAQKNGRSVEAVLQQANDKHILARQQAELRRNPPPIHGSARWAQLPELKAANLIQDNSGAGISLGSVDGQPVTWHGEGHLLTVAPTRKGKGTMQIIPNLLQYKGAAVVLDPKGELHKATAKWRSENVGPVYVLNPFGAEHLGNFTHAFNPLDGIKDSDGAVELAETICPRQENSQNAFFDNESVGFLSAVIEFTARYMAGADKNLGAIRDDVASLSPQFRKLMAAMAHATMPSSISNAATHFLTKNKETGQPRVLDSLNQHLRIWDSAGLRRATAKSDFDFSDLKAKTDKPMTVYLILPFDKIGAYSAFVRMVFHTALNAMLRTPEKPDIPVLFILDEFLALEPDEKFQSALRTHAGAGVRLWFFLQDLPTLKQKYPQTWESFRQTDVKTFFGTNDQYTAKLISEELGRFTLAYEQPNLSASMSGGDHGSGSYSISNNVQFTGRDLLTPDEVVEHLKGTSTQRPAIHFMGDQVRPVTTQLKPWFNSDLQDRGA